MPTGGAVYAVVFIALTLLFLRRCGEVDLPPEQSLTVVLAGAIGAMVGTRLFFLITTGALFRLTPFEWVDPSRGTASWGAYLGGLLGVVLYARTTGNGWAFVDLGASCAGLSEVIGRWACWLIGDDFGRVTSAWWGIRFPAASPAHAAHVARGLVAQSAAASLPVQPLQFFLMLNAACVFALVTLIWRRRRTRRGYTLGAFFLLHGATRFWWEFLRDPDAGGAHALLSTSQWTCALLVVAGGALVYRARVSTRSANSSGPWSSHRMRPA